jgi:hypothetical protein
MANYSDGEALLSTILAHGYTCGSDWGRHLPRDHFDYYRIPVIATQTPVRPIDFPGGSDLPTLYMVLMIPTGILPTAIRLHALDLAALGSPSLNSTRDCIHHADS